MSVGYQRNQFCPPYIQFCNKSCVKLLGFDVKCDAENNFQEAKGIQLESVHIDEDQTFEGLDFEPKQISFSDLL